MINIGLVREKLSVGQTFKNFNDLCNVLGEDAKRGTSRISQINEYKRFFDFEPIEKGKHPIIIKEIYDIPGAILDGRSNGANVKYSKNIEMVLLNYIRNNGINNTIICYRSELLLLLAIVNNYYSDDGYDNELIDDKVVSRKQIDDWKNIANQVIDKILLSALSSMQKRELIKYKIELIYRYDNTDHIATSDEELYYEKVKKQELIKLGQKYNKVFKSLFEIYPKYSQEFYKMLNKRIFELKGWTNIRQHFNILVIASYDFDGFTDDMIQQCKNEINQDVSKAINNKIMKSYISLRNKIEEEIAQKNEHMVIGNTPKWSSKLYYTVYESDYVERLSKLTDEYITI